MAFKVGDVVVLKSGGPEMTVAELHNVVGDKSVKCQWFGGRKLEEGWFPVPSLIPAPDGDKK